MASLEQETRTYLRQTLGVTDHLRAWKGVRKLPAFLAARYRFAQGKLMGHDLLFVLDEAESPEPPSVIGKHVDLIQAKCPAVIVYVREQITSYHRQRLIDRQVPFLVPGNQLYIPDLGVALREYFRAARSAPEQFRPATQAILIHALLHHPDQPVSAADLAPALGYSAMTLSRAFDEIEAAGLAESQLVGRQRTLRFGDPPRQCWQAAITRMGDPVRSRHFVEGDRPGPEGLLAGQEALARYTRISSPALPVIALGHQDWLGSSEDYAGDLVAEGDPASVEIEVWKYQPREFRKKGVVDPLSLSLSLQGSYDERVERALDELLDQLPW